MGILYKKADSAQKFQSGGWWDSAVNSAQGFAADHLGQDQWASNSDTQVKEAITKAKADKEKFASEEKNKKWGNSQSGGWNKTFTDEEVRAKQKELGIKVDGKWGKDSATAYNKKMARGGGEKGIEGSDPGNAPEVKPQEAGFFSAFSGKELTDEEKLKESNIAAIKENQETAPDIYGVIPAKYRMFAKNIVSPSDDIGSDFFTAEEINNLGKITKGKKKISYADYKTDSVAKSGTGTGGNADWKRVIGQGTKKNNHVQDYYDFNTGEDSKSLKEGVEGVTDAQLKEERTSGGMSNFAGALRDSWGSFSKDASLGQNIYNIARTGIAPHYSSVEYKKDLKGTLSSDGRNKMNIQVPKYDSSGKVVYKAGGILYKK